MCARVGAILDRAQRDGQQVEQPHEVGLGDPLRLRGEPLVALGSHPQLVRDTAERTHDEQFARVDFEVAGGNREVAPCLREPCRSFQRAARVVGGHRIQRAEQHVLVSHAEYRQDIGGCDLITGVGDELLERAERVTERSGGVAGQQRQRVGSDRDRLLLGDPAQHA